MPSIWPPPPSLPLTGTSVGVLSGLTYTTNNTTGVGTLGSATRPFKAEGVATADLDKDVFKTPVETLLDLWVARFGNEWIDLDTIENDPFFSLAYKRLKALGQLETHYLTDRSRFVCRKPT